MPVIEKSPEQRIFDAIYMTCQQLGYDVYDYLPASEARVPFVFIGEIFQQDRLTKSNLYGDVQVTVHIYNSYKKRSETTTMRDKIKLEMYKVKNVGGMSLNLKRGTGQVLIDDSTGEPLLHGILELEFTFH